MAKDNQQSLLSEFKKGELRALSRLISLAENRDPILPAILKELYPNCGKAQIIGITGPPGAGKSTLINSYVKWLRGQNKKVAVIAVDPVSPFTGGALLGDRIRLQEHFNDDKVFIRSLSTRGKLGGLSIAAREVSFLVDAFGFDTILIETVGVGQSEVEIRKIADCSALVLVPEWGDGIQTLKAGILEIADLFVVNKSDREGADRIVTELKNMLMMGGKELNVLSTRHDDFSSFEKVFESIQNFFETEGTLIKTRRQNSLKEIVGEWLNALVQAETEVWLRKKVSVTQNPFELIMEFQKKFPPGSLFNK